ncbi:protein ECT2 isoform X2 [Dendroctonus ponderosae]|uniref:Protein ECT2 n=1 Tax=Dendroctonus ponderosae TaxID=77166 RepID=A0AAR5Q1Q3_DENPD|nr:protein ECT2 isoform X2 [Dendroctonus ponderosae]
MDENNAQIQAQGSVCSDSTAEEAHKSDDYDRRICLIGGLANDSGLQSVAESFEVPVVHSQDGREYMNDTACCTYYIIDNFDGSLFNSLCKCRQIILGPPALQQLGRKDPKELPDNTRPLFNLAMRGVVVCFTGFRNKDVLTKLVPLIHHMGGSIRRDMTAKVTHLIANSCGGDKYQYASTFKVPVMNLQWVLDSWEQNRWDLDFSASQEMFMNIYRLKPFHGAKVCFLGFPEDEEHHMTEVLLSNGGTVTTLDDPNCSHVVVDEASVVERPDVTGPRAFVVKAEWFWTSVQKECSLDEKEYLFDDYIEHIVSPAARRDSHATPSSASRRKRKRLHDTLQSLVQQTQSPALHKRRSSVSDAGRLSVSGSFLDCTASPAEPGIVEGGDAQVESPRKNVTTRQQVVLELLETEKNYVEILRTIVSLFKNYLELMPDEEALLNNTELNLIFGKLPPIYETHVKILDELRWTIAHWHEERSIGNIIIKYSTELQRAYPPFINYFEEMKEVLTSCDQSKPRFHAFLKAMQTKPECGRQSLQELMIRPVQRLGSISLLLKDILKHTAKTNPDHAAVEKALAALREVMAHINEDKRKAEGQVTLFNIFNEIDNCPPDIVSSHRSYITKVEVVQLSSSEGLSSKGSSLVLFVFSDQLEVCKKKSKTTMKSPSASGFQLQGRPNVKLYKHVKMMNLNTIKRVIDIKETEACQKVFSLVCKSSEESKEKLFSFAMTDEYPDKVGFLKLLTRTMANNVCSADADKFMAYLEPQQLDIDTNDITNGTLSKYLNFAKSRLKVGRTFSFNKSTPSKLKRAVSSMMSPFGSSTNLTPASQLANMRLASYSNINELANNGENSDESPPTAPMSVQPTRKAKAASLGANAFQRL